MLLNKVKNTALLLAALCILAAGGIFAHLATQAQPPGPQDRTAPPAQVAQPKTPKRAPDQPAGPAKPRPGAVGRTTQQRCSVVAFHQVDIYPTVAGTLKSLPVDIGDRVKKGQVLAEIDAPLIAFEQKLAFAVLEQAKGQVRESEAALATSRTELQHARGVIQGHKAELDGAGAAATFREKQRERLKELEARGAIDIKLLNEQEERLSAAKALAAAARAALANARTDETVKQSKLVQAEASIETAKARVRVAEVGLAKAQHLSSLTTLVAPFDGVVTHRNIQVGNLVRPGEQGGLTPLLTIDRTDLLRVVVAIPERDVPAAKVGDMVNLSIDALPGVEFKKMKIARIGYTVDPKTHSMRVEIDVPNPEQLLRPGMTGDATIHLQKGPANPANPKGDTAPVVPKQAKTTKGAGGNDRAAKEALLETAREVYQLNLARAQKIGGVTAEEIYLWSRRWLEARLDLVSQQAQRISAYREHVERMVALEARAKALLAAAHGGRPDVDAGSYFRMQAESWLEQVKSK